MDARTDSYLAIDSTSTGSQNVSFDAQLELLPQELLWILDELLRLEVSPVESSLCPSDFRLRIGWDG